MQVLRNKSGFIILLSFFQINTIYMAKMTNQLFARLRLEK